MSGFRTYPPPDGGDPAVARFDVLPDYASGFAFHWRIRGGFSAPGPWTFRVQRGRTQEGPWSDVSPALSGCSCWKAPGGLRVSKSDTLFFRVVLSTPSGEFPSPVRSPYGDLSRDEFLIAREIMRREVLHMAGMAGVECDVWNVASEGPRCPRCLDPVTGHPRDGRCRHCLGTGFDPPYLGPFRTWASFSEDSQHRVQEGQEGEGVVEQRPFQARMACSVPVRKNDVVRDVRSGKCYFVNASLSAAELRRVPLVRTLELSEAATTDPAYLAVTGRYGAGEAGEGGGHGA